MAILNCCCVPSARKKKDKGSNLSSRAVALKALHMKKLEQASVKPLDTDGLKSMTFGASPPSESRKNSSCSARLTGGEGPVASDGAVEVAYEGEDEHEENASIIREFSDFDLQAKGVNSIQEGFELGNTKMDSSVSFDYEMKEEAVAKADKDGVKSFDVIQSGHVSDPGIGRAELWVSPRLKRSCSNLESRDMLRKAAHRLQPSKSHSFEELWELSASVGEGLISGSPASIMTQRSADRVMLKKHSSSQVLPSASRKLWWKLFLWSHRNLQQARTAKAQTLKEGATLNKQGGYYSDTLEPEPNQAIKLSNMESPGSFTKQSMDKIPLDNYDDNRSWDGFQKGLSGLWQQKQWVAFPAVSTSSFNRVDEWVRDLETESIHLVDDANDETLISFPPSPDTGETSARSVAQMTRRPDVNLSEEILHSNSIIQSLNSSSTIAYMSGIGLKAVPTISCFSGLRSVDLSNNFIVHITLGSLPKGLHALNLSRNKINTIEGLRELTRLRVLDLSYNRISRIGHGLSNCTLIKELYLAGNKISDVEGLHRLLKLTVLDLSFNKITTTKALGQLVANYNSLLALDLLGNPIQSNVSVDQLRKAVCSLLPRVAYLNKQPIKPRRGREVVTDSVAKAALGIGSSSFRRTKLAYLSKQPIKPQRGREVLTDSVAKAALDVGSSSSRRTVRRVSQGGSMASSGIRSSAIGQKSGKRSKGKSHRH